MNRYVLEGVIRDVAAGKHVALVASTRRLARKVFNNIAASDVPWDKGRFTKGEENLHLGGGRLVIVTADGRGPRGFSLDVAVMLDGLRPIEGTKRYDEFMENIRLTGVTRPAGVELVFCE